MLHLTPSAMAWHRNMKLPVVLMGLSLGSKHSISSERIGCATVAPGETCEADSRRRVRGPMDACKCGTAFRLPSTYHYNQSKQLIHSRFVGYLHSERIVDRCVCSKEKRKRHYTDNGRAPWNGLQHGTLNCFRSQSPVSIARCLFTQPCSRFPCQQLGPASSASRHTA